MQTVLLIFQSKLVFLLQFVFFFFFNKAYEKSNSTAFYQSGHSWHSVLVDTLSLAKCFACAAAALQMNVHPLVSSGSSCWL